jgi:hypothetical protein
MDAEILCSKQAQVLLVIPLGYDQHSESVAAEKYDLTLLHLFNVCGKCGGRHPTLFFGCSFSDTCWTYLGVHWDLTLDFQAMVLHARIQFDSVIFREVFIIGCRALWCHRNAIIFYVAYLSFSQWRRFFISELQVVSHRVKPRVKEEIRIFMSSLFF